MGPPTWNVNCSPGSASTASRRKPVFTCTWKRTGCSVPCLPTTISPDSRTPRSTRSPASARSARRSAEEKVCSIPRSRGDRLRWSGNAPSTRRVASCSAPQRRVTLSAPTTTVTVSWRPSSPAASSRNVHGTTAEIGASGGSRRAHRSDRQPVAVGGDEPQHVVVRFQEAAAQHRERRVRVGGEPHRAERGEEVGGAEDDTCTPAPLARRAGGESLPVRAGRRRAPSRAGRDAGRGVRGRPCPLSTAAMSFTGTPTRRIAATRTAASTCRSAYQR